MNSSYLIFFDESCPLCRKWMEWVCHKDRKKSFIFSPLEGSTFEKVFKEKSRFYLSLNSIILVENPFSEKPKISIRSKAIRKIAWVLGGKYRLIGLLSLFFLGADWMYQWIASRRSKMTVKGNLGLSLPKDRLLP